MTDKRIKISAKKETSTTAPSSVSELNKELKKEDKKGRIKRINSNLPLDLYEQMEEFMEAKSYTLKGFLVYAIKEFLKNNQ